jgi:selenocysteine-specific translation elongation factor
MTKNRDLNLDQSVVIVHGSSRVDHLSNVTRKKRIMIGILMILIVGIATYLFHRHTQVVTISELDTIQTQTDTIVQTKGVQAALAVYTRKIPNAANNHVRSQLDIQAGAIALNAHQYNTALNYAMQSNDLESTSESSALIAAIYQQQGNIAQAVFYYDKAASEVKGPVSPGGLTASYYLQEAQDAESGRPH